MYESKATLKNFGGKLIFENKYENTRLESILGEAKVNLYESKLIAIKMGSHLTGAIKYGNTNLDNIAGNIKLELYESPITINSNGDIILRAKYGNIDLQGNFKAVDIESYESRIQLNAAETFKSTIKIQNKYGNITLYNLDLEKFRLKAKANDGRIFIPFLDTDPDEKRVSYQWYQTALPSITLDNYDGNINIK